MLRWSIILHPSRTDGLQVQTRLYNSSVSSSCVHSVCKPEFENDFSSRYTTLKKIFSYLCFFIYNCCVVEVKCVYIFQSVLTESWLYKLHMSVSLFFNFKFSIDEKVSKPQINVGVIFDYFVYTGMCCEIFLCRWYFSI